MRVRKQKKEFFFSRMESFLFNFCLIGKSFLIYDDDDFFFFKYFIPFNLYEKFSAGS